MKKMIFGLEMAILCIIVLAIAVSVFYPKNDNSKETAIADDSEGNYFYYDKEYVPKSKGAKLPELEISDKQIDALSVTDSKGMLDYVTNNYKYTSSTADLINSIFPKDWDGKDVRVDYSEETGLTQYLFYDVDEGICEIQLNDDKTIAYITYDNRVLDDEDKHIVSTYSCFYGISNYMKQIEDASIVMDKENQAYYYHGKRDDSQFANMKSYMQTDEFNEGVKVLFSNDNGQCGCGCGGNSENPCSCGDSCSDDSMDSSESQDGCSCKDLGGCIDENSDCHCDRCNMEMKK